jgi:hypothetical protein
MYMIGEEVGFGRYLYYPMNNRQHSRDLGRMSSRHKNNSVTVGVIERLKILLHIREIPDSNLGPDSSYPD